MNHDAKYDEKRQVFRVRLGEHEEDLCPADAHGLLQRLRKAMGEWGKSSKFERQADESTRAYSEFYKVKHPQKVFYDVRRVHTVYLDGTPCDIGSRSVGRIECFDDTRAIVSTLRWWSAGQFGAHGKVTMRGDGFRYEDKDDILDLVPIGCYPGHG